jgi:hypothetical protein
MIDEAPEMRAPCTALRPSGPQPTTATVDPGRRMPVPCEVVGAQARHRHAAADHAEIRGRRLGEDRDDPLLEGHHQFGEPADVRVGVDRSAVAQVGHRHQIVGPLAAEELAHVAAAAQALVAGAALRVPGHATRMPHLRAATSGPQRPSNQRRRRRALESTPSRARLPKAAVHRGRAPSTAPVDSSSRDWSPRCSPALPARDRTQRTLFERVRKVPGPREPSL